MLKAPKFWYNINADLPSPPPPPLHPGTKQPAGPDDFAPLFPMGLIMQEVSTEREIEIPEPVREIYKQWRPSPLYRARRLEKYLDTPAKIYYKYEGVSPTGSHKPNTAVAQAFFNKEEGTKKISLGVKQLTEDPWKNLDEKYPLNAEVTGTVVNLTDFGIFVEVSEGVEGLVHISEIDTEIPKEKLQQFYPVNAQIRARVIKVDLEERRLGLSIIEVTEPSAENESSAPSNSEETVEPEAEVKQEEAKVEAEETPEAETIAAEQTETPSDPVASEEEEVKAEKPKKKTRTKAKKAEKEAEPSAEEKQEDSVEEETETS